MPQFGRLVYSRIGSCLRAALACFAAAVVTGPVASAHFLWVLPPSEGSDQFAVVFSEAMEPGEPQFLERFDGVRATLHGPEGATREVRLQTADDRLIGTIPDDFDVVAIEVPVTWGVFSRGDQPFLLRYRAIGIVDFEQFEAERLDRRLPGPLLHMAAEEEALRVRATTGQNPLKNEEIQVFGPDPSHLETDELGRTLWHPARPGQYGLMTKATEDRAGQWEGEDYPQARSYTTVTLNLEKAYAGSTERRGGAVGRTSFPDLPLPLTSFGAARTSDAIYVYGGHTGSAHSYSMAEQSDQLLRLDLNDRDSQWQRVAEGPRLQGLALVAHDGRLIRIGGFTARNEEGEEQDLHSQPTVAAYDPESGQWSELPDLPEPRSSFGAALLGDRVFVVGGWALDHPREIQWHETAWQLDLAADNPRWMPLPEPPFQRRALAVVAHDDKLYVIGGMERGGEPTKETAVYDPAARQWSEGPALPGRPMSGFGAAAVSHRGRLIVSTIDGDLQQLSSDGKSWERIGETDDAKFFHHVLPLDDDRLLSIGGANMSIGKFRELEVIDLTAEK